MWKMLRPSHNYQPVSIPQQNTIKNSLALFVQDRNNASLFAPAEANYQRKNKIGHNGLYEVEFKYYFILSHIILTKCYEKGILMKI